MHIAKFESSPIYFAFYLIDYFFDFDSQFCSLTKLLKRLSYLESLVRVISLLFLQAQRLFFVNIFTPDL